MYAVPMENANGSLNERINRPGNSPVLDESNTFRLGRIHERIMAAGYKYELMSNGDTGDIADGLHRAHKSRQLQLRLQIAVVLLVAVVITLSALLAWSWTRGSDSEVCETTKCVSVSAYILNKMNKTVDPCQDFYLYACGGWEDTTFIPPERARFDSFGQLDINIKAEMKQLLEDTSTLYKGRQSTAVAKLKAYYRTCMDIDAIEAAGTQPIHKVINELGSWSLTPFSSNANDKLPAWDFITALITYHKMGQSPLFLFSITVDDKNNSRYMIQFSQAGLTLDEAEEYLNDSEKYHEAYLDFAVKMVQLLGGDRSSAYVKMEAIYQFEKNLAEIFLRKETLLDPIGMYNVMTVAEFQRLIGQEINIMQFISGILQDIDESTLIQVPTVSYFQKLGPLLSKTSKQVLQDYMMWNFLQNIPGYLPQAFVDTVMGLTKTELGVSTVSPRWQRCVSKANNAFEFVVSALYVEDKFPPESRSQMLEILSSIQSAFIVNLDTVKWMDEATRNRAKKKAIAMGKLVGYPDWIMEPMKLDDFYANVNIKEGAFLMSYINLLKASMERMWNRLFTIPNKYQWSASSIEVNAYFRTTFNQIVIPAGLLQRPFFDLKFPLSFMYGSIGMIAGHELTHGFDNQGRMYDKFGTLNNWWSDSSSRSFMQHSQCMVTQYSNFSMFGKNFNGEFTLAENIADNGGLKLGYAAYISQAGKTRIKEPVLPALKLTPQQLYFLGFAQVWCSFYRPEFTVHSLMSDVHTIAKYRVLGTLANSREFADAYSCPAGSPSNPVQKCEVW